MSSSSPPTPSGRLAADKLHLRVETIGRRAYRIASLRSGCGATYSTNYYHETWHVLCNPPGAATFARLLWGLSFQKQPGTLVCIHGQHLRPTPFDADPSDPIVLVPTALTPVIADDLRALRERLRRPSREGTRINWPTFGLDLALAERAEAYETTWRARRWEWQRDGDRLDVRRAGGCVVMAGPACALREAALGVHRMATRGTVYSGQNAIELGARGKRGPHSSPGEVQMFDRYHPMLSEAAEARRRVLADGQARASHDELLWDIGLCREGVRAERSAAQLARSKNG
ncbi:MAG: hypothetical protein MUF34_29595 [Polyangiaceae bacterium]|jgi:hypothetical protein|nr:hypothetical protein [Polyangiaceae bacterium]